MMIFDYRKLDRIFKRYALQMSKVDELLVKHNSLTFDETSAVKGRMLENDLQQLLGADYTNFYPTEQIIETQAFLNEYIVNFYIPFKLGELPNQCSVPMVIISYIDFLRERIKG